MEKILSILKMTDISNEAKEKLSGAQQSFTILEAINLTVWWKLKEARNTGTTCLEWASQNQHFRIMKQLATSFTLSMVYAATQTLLMLDADASKLNWLQRE